MDLKKTGELIAESRKALGMTQKQLADAIGVTDKAISRWETGRGFPDAVYLQPLSQALGISITEIVNGELTQPENAARQADDALLSALAYGRRMRRSVAAAVLALVGVALSLSPMYVLGANVDQLMVLGLFLLAMAAMLQFWKKGPSPKLAQILSVIALLAAVVLQALPVSAVLVFRGPTYYNRNLYSCFDLMLWGYANFAPGLAAILAVAALILLVLLLLGKKGNMRNSIFVCMILSGLLMPLPMLLLGGEYGTPASLAAALLLFSAAFFQARANANQ